jgi:hypothetical protein
LATTLSEYELEVFPELEVPGGGADRESKLFFRALATLARRTRPSKRPLLTRVAVSAARQGIRGGSPALRRAASRTTSVLVDAPDTSTNEPSPLTDATTSYGGTNGFVDSSGATTDDPNKAVASYWQWGEGEEEISPIRRIYPDVMIEHLGHAAAEAQSEAEAQALAGAMVPIAARIVPRAAPAILHAAPSLVCGLAGVVRTLRRNQVTRPLVRVVPTIVRSTALKLANEALRGNGVTPQTAVRVLANPTARVLGNPRHAARAFRRSQALDRQFHRNPSPAPPCPGCQRCAAAAR